MHPIRRTIAVIPVLALLLLALLTPATLAQGRLILRGERTLTVTHGPVAISLIDATSDGHQLGDVRVTSVATATAGSDETGRLDATLTTTAVDVPGPGDEIRISDLVFSFGSGVDQIVVHGTSVYPAAGATIAIGASTIRPVVGGSGSYAAATGWAETWHLDDGTWRHTFHLLGTFRRAIIHPGPDGHGGRQGPAKSPAASPVASPAAGIVRTPLGSAEPDTAPGEQLGLWHYTIPAGAALVPHTHPGWQVARIVAGTLTYTIIEGKATVLRGDGTTEIHGADETITLGSGDSIVENPGLAHFGANLGTQPVEIYAASLFTDGAAPATALASPSPAASVSP